MDFSANRLKLLSKLHNGVIVATAHDALQYTADAAIPFRQDASFLWLTGIEEPGWKVVIDGKRKRTTLVCPELSAQQIIFDGDANSVGAQRIASAENVISHADFEAYLRDLARSHTVVYNIYDNNSYGFVLNPAQKDLDASLKRIFTSTVECSAELNSLKAVKTSAEIKLIQKSIDMTIDAFEKVKTALPALRYEYEVEAIFDYEFRRRNAMHAYQPIVASGANACTLHYVKNDAKLARSAPLLLDVGARFGIYCADITRTYIHNPTARQREIHAELQSIQAEIISLLETGLPLVEYAKQSDTLIAKGLVRLGLLPSVYDEKGYRRYMPHAVSHGLGIDVHDSLGKPRVLEEGMVITVEPGIYVAEEKIGMRIEDDILITAKGRKNLSDKLSTDW